MLKKILLAVAALIAVVLIVAAFQPTEFAVTRKATLAAPASSVFPLVNDFREWPKWSPWEKLDPAMKRELSGPPSGVGAVYGWVGNDDVGEGRMTILESKPDELVRVRLEFIKPWEATSTIEFTFAPEGGGTLVTWSMKGENNYLCKLISMFMDMDKMIGPDFEKGLAALSAEVTKANPPR
jgi:uncharacterized protein YndB with AHSA1/START domain